MIEENKDIMMGVIVLGLGVFVLLSDGNPLLAFLIFVCMTLYFLFFGLTDNRPATIYRNSTRRPKPKQNSILPSQVVQWNEGLWLQRNKNPRQNRILPTTSAPMTNETTIAEKIKSIHIANEFKCPSCGATVNPTDMKCKHCGSVLVATADLPKPERWGDIEIGQSVQVKHPIKGKMSLPVIHRVYYAELWQAQMRPNVPWTLTGSYYVGLGLENDMVLMNWQSRFYLLDSRSALTDMDINRDLAQPARTFAASNQTADVRFQYKGITWRMEDIGRFRIEFVEGDGIRVSPGAVGRFIHASSNDQVLAVEDYQSGGSGLDSLWTGCQIQEKDIQF